MCVCTEQAAHCLRCVSAAVSPPCRRLPAGYGPGAGAGYPRVMYVPFFGFNKEPFSIAPDPRFLFMSEMHREALAHLLYGLAGGGGFVLLTGEIGAGKTTVCRAFLEQIPAQCTVAYIFNPKLSATELLQTVCDEFGIPRPGGAAATMKEHVDALNAFLLQAHAQGRQGVLIIDEAQSLADEVLEQLRLLTNLETSRRKLLQIVLIGQPELRQRLAQPGLEQLAQRVIARLHLPALNAAQTVQYVHHRLMVASSQRPAGTGSQRRTVRMPFERPALQRIHRLTGGIPRRINLLCDRALLGAYAQGHSRVDRRTVEQAAREVFGRPAWPAQAGRLATGSRGVLIVAVVIVMVLTAGLGLALAWLGPRSAPARAPLMARLPSLPGPAGSAAAAAALSPAASAVAALPLATQAGGSRPAASTATAASAAASAAAPLSPGSALAPSSATAAVLAAAQHSEAEAWRELGRLWNLAIGAGDPCLATATARVLCFRSSGGLAVVRQLGRPGLMVLRDAQDRPRYALLVALSDEHATLRVGTATWQLALPALAGVWRGEFATLWRAPPGWRDPGEGPPGPELRRWLAQQLDRAGSGAPELPLRARVWAFQVAQGLPPDGLAGPMTLMLLGRAGGVGEPRLGSDR